MAVGAAATVVDLVALFVMVALLGMAPRAASVPALLLAATVQFLGQRRFAFHATDGDAIGQAARFAGIHAITILLNAVLFDTAVRLLGDAAPLWALRLVIGNAVYLAWSFPMLRRAFTSRRNERAPHRGCTAPGRRDLGVRGRRT